MAFRKHIYLQSSIARIIYSASGVDINNCSNHFRTHTHSHLGLPVSCNELIICGHTIWRRIVLLTTLYTRNELKWLCTNRAELKKDGRPLCFHARFEYRF